MDTSGTPSPNVIDRRALARRSLAWTILALFGFASGRASAPSDPDSDLVQVTSAALDRGQDHWSRAVGAPRWRDARVVLIDRAESTPCGTADRESGPFYCPANERIYLDLSFLRAIDGDLARAYVIAHELGHHVQRVVGDRPGASDVEIELEADCYAGAWMLDEMLRGRVDDGDVAAALAEAAAVGDDRICPDCDRESWTHGSSAERAAAVVRGINGESCR